MRKVLILIISFMVLLVFSVNSKANIVDSFCYPAGNQCMGEGETIITQPFNTAHNNGFLGSDGIWHFGHTGLDIAGGGDIKAIGNGKVVDAGYSNGFGNHVRIKHILPNGTIFYSQYGHLQNNSITVNVNDFVASGEVIGIMGNTGFSTGIHLHWEVKDSQSNTDGLGYSYGDANIIAHYYNPTPFIESNNYAISYQYDFPNHNSQGWATGYNTTVYQDPVDTNTFGVSITGSNPGIISPQYPSGLMAADIIAHFSMRQKSDNCSFLVGSIWVKDETGSWNNQVPLELVNADYGYNNGVFRNQDYNLYRANFSVLRNDLQVRQFSIELTEGCGTNERWIMHWLKVYQIDPIVIASGSGGGIYEPENLTAIAVSSSQINLTWDRGLNPAEWNLTYKIYRNATNNSGSASYVDSTANLSYSNTGLSPSTEYYYWVKAVLDTDESEFSAYSTATTQSGQPSANYTFNSSLTTDYVDPNTGDHNPEKTVFYNGDNSVYSWLMLNNVYESLSVDWYWYNPANILAATSSLITEDPGEGYYWGGYILYTWLNISSLTDYGQWHVDAFVDNSLVSSNYFTITTNPPTANFTADATTGIAPLTVQFTDTSVGYVSSWSWDFGDGTYSTAQNPTHTYSAQGNYTVALTAANYGGSGTEIKQSFITVLEPVPVYTFNSSIITDYVSPYTGNHDPEKIIFYNKDNYVYSWIRLDDIYEPLAVSWKWYGPSDFIGEWGLTTQDPGEGSYYHGYILWSYQRITDTNNYGVWHIDFYVNGEKIATDYFTITTDPPIANFAVHTTSGSTVQFIDTSAGHVTGWQWDFGDGTSSVLQNPEHAYLLEGEYQVRFTATGYGGSDDEDRIVFVSELETCFSPARILGDTTVYYESLQSAYDAANDGDTLQIRESEFDNNLLANQDKTIVLNGGYNCDYSSSTCNVVSGTITIDSGSVSIEDCPETELCRNLPAPQLVLRGKEDYTVDGVEYTHFRLSVANRDEYGGLFYSAPNLPPCGLNTNASRTWVEMYDNNNEYIYGFCGLDSENYLHELRFSMRKDYPIESVYVILIDRECGVSYTSNFIVFN